MLSRIAKYLIPQVRKELKEVKKQAMHILSGKAFGGFVFYLKLVTKVLEYRCMLVVFQEL